MKRSTSRAGGARSKVTLALAVCVGSWACKSPPAKPPPCETEPRSGSDTACGEQTSSGASEGTSQGSGTTHAPSSSDATLDDPTADPTPSAFFELGAGENTFRPLDNGDEVPVVLGGQGLYMLPFIVRGQGFPVAPDPTDFNDPRAPILELTLDIDGFNNGPGGHFYRLANYPLGFELLPSGLYESARYVPLLLPEEASPPDPIIGKTVRLRARLRPAGVAPLTFERDLLVGPVRESESATTSDTASSGSTG